METEGGPAEQKKNKGWNMIWRKLFLLGLFVFLTFDYAAAATYQKYVYSGAKGNGSGSDWTNAYTDTPSSFQRDTIYYYAGGSYSPPYLNTGASGTAQIIIQKATPANHGTNTGWSDGLASTVARFNGSIQIFTSYITIDGSTGGYPTSEPYGFEVYLPSASYHLITAPDWNARPTNITIKHCELHYAPSARSDDSKTAHGFYFVSPVDNLYIGYCYIHDLPGCGILTRFVSNVVFEYNHIARNRSTPAWHAEGWSDSGSNNIVCRYNRWEDVEGTGVIVNLNAGGVSSADNWQIYGNIIYFTYGHTTGSFGGDGLVTCINSQKCTNWKIYNNTIANIDSGLNSGMGNEIYSSTNVLYNNLWYCDPGLRCLPANNHNIVADYNYYSSNISHPSEAHEQIGGNPFVNLSSYNFHLKADTASGLSLGSPFNQDMDRVIRGTNGNWNRGAYQFSTGQALTPPRNVRILQ